LLRLLRILSGISGAGVRRFLLSIQLLCRQSNDDESSIKVLFAQLSAIAAMHTSLAILIFFWYGHRALFADV